MEGSITWEALAYAVGIVGAGGGLWWGLQKRIHAVQQDLNDYKLHSAREFIRNDHLVKMEERLIATEARTLAAIERLTSRIDSLIEHRPKRSTARNG